MSPSETPAAWQKEYPGTPVRIVAYERLDKRRVVYLKWRERGEWQRKSTGLQVRTAAGRIIESVIRRVDAAVAEQQAELLRAHGHEETAQRTGPLRLLEGLELATHETRGLYKTDTPHRREVQRSVRHAARILGDRKTWNAMKPADLSEIFEVRRREVDSLPGSRGGHRAAEIVVSHVLTIASWLRGEGLILAGACLPPRHWKKRYRGDKAPEPFRPRYTQDEVRAILAAGPRIDPRLGLLLELGLELRSGQVIRTMRSQLDLTARQVRIRGAGRKRGQLLQLMPEEFATVEAALAGYLSRLEERFQAGELTDYPLFPAGQLTGGRKSPEDAVSTAEAGAAGHIGRRTAGKWFLEAEALAGVPHIKGRAWYGARRQSVDGAKEARISREGLKALGGWSDTQVPDAIYAEQEAQYAAVEAGQQRQKNRGRVPGQTEPGEKNAPHPGSG